MTPSPVTLTVPLSVSKGCFKIYSLFFSFEPMTHLGDHPERELLGPSSILGQVSLISCFLITPFPGVGPTWSLPLGEGGLGLEGEAPGVPLIGDPPPGFPEPQ